MSDPTAHWIAGWLKDNAPAETGTAVGPIESVDPFDTIEELAAERLVRIRRDEFHTGRRLARFALAQLGCPASPIPVDKGRAPVWPKGYCGSISHSRTLCVAHVARTDGLLTGIGVDIEPDAPLRDGVLTLVSRPDERVGLSDRGMLLLFMAKEAFFKAYFPNTLSFLEFHDARVAVDEGRGAFELTLVAKDRPSLLGRRSFAGRLDSREGHNVAAIWITP